MTGRSNAPDELSVDFSYAFAAPHRLTVTQPDSSDKTLLDAYPGWLRMAWSYDNLLDKPLACYTPPAANWEVHLKPELDGQPFAQSRWTRAEGWLPMLENVYGDDRVGMRLEVAGGKTAAIVKVDVTNNDGKPHRFVLRCERPHRFMGFNPAWVQPEWDNDVLLAGWQERADRVLVLSIGGNEKPVPGPTAMCQAWDLGPGEARTGWLVRPYEAYREDLTTLRARDWAREMADAESEWRALLGRSCGVNIPDTGVANALRACLADLFVMREPVADGYVAACPGTEVYRAANAFEAAIVAVALDQSGFHREAAEGYRLCLEMQEDDGEWADPKGWGHFMWGGSGFKSWAAMEHYRLTGDREYLAQVYPRMAASSRWQERQRARTRVMGSAGRPLTYGLMPRGMGDCGLMNDADMYGVFLPHNIWAVYADALAIEAAEALGQTRDLDELRRIHQTAQADLMQAIDRGAIQEDGYRWIPGVPGKTSGSRWGVLNALFPCRLLPADHELITGTLHHIESHTSAGGIPIHTGWMQDGMWVAITLDNIAEAQLCRGNGDAAARYLYATLNHGTPLHTWCEERGQEPGTTKTSGDRQHLWTPVAVVRLVRDLLVMEHGDGLHLARGVARQWLASGKPVGIAHAPTHFGEISYEIRYDSGSKCVTGVVVFPAEPSMEWAVLHIRLPHGLKVESVDPESGAALLPDGNAIRWQKPHGEVRVVAAIGS